jgi:hypothetical protein
MAPNPGGRQQGPDVRQVVVGLAAQSLEERDGLARPGQGLADGAGVLGGSQGLDAVLAGDTSGMRQEEGPDGLEFQGPEAMLVQRRS